MTINTFARKQKKLVSIGFPVHNGERFLEGALDSLLMQDYENFELIISDNASTDSTQEICKSYAVKDKRITYYRNERNLGVVENFNRLLSFSQGEYFMWAACDDLWEPSFLSTLLDIYKNHPDAVVTFCMFDNIDVEEKRVRLYPLIKSLSCIESDLSRANHFLWYPEHEGSANFVYGLMNASVIKETGGLRVYGKGSVAIDNLLVFRLALLGKFVVTDELLFHKRLIPEGASSDKWNFFEWLEYRGLYRRIIFESKILLLKKIFLICSATVRQIVYFMSTILKGLLFVVKNNDTKDTLL